MIDVQRILQENGSSCGNIGLPSPQRESRGDPLAHQDPPPSFDDEQQHLVESVLATVCLVNAGSETTQRKICIMSMRLEARERHVFSELAAHLRHLNRRVVCAAWTGIATSYLDDIWMYHSELPVTVLENCTCNIRPTSEHADLLRGVDLFISLCYVERHCSYYIVFAFLFF